MSQSAHKDGASNTYLNTSLFDLFQEVKNKYSFEESIFTLEHAEMWVRLAVVDDEVANQLYEHCSSVLQLPLHVNSYAQAMEHSNNLYKQALAMHYIRSLGARHLLNHVYQNLSFDQNKEKLLTTECSTGTSDTINQQKTVNWFVSKNPLYQVSLEHSTWHDELSKVEQKRDGVSHFPPLKRLYAENTMAETALNLVQDIALSIDPIRDKLLRLVNDYLSKFSACDDTETVVRSNSLKDWLWSQWRDGIQDEAMLLIAYQSVKDQPKRAETLALRLALLSPQLAERACSSLKALPNDQKLSFAVALEKQLKRVGRIKLWVSCRTALAIEK